jgi:membrane-associated protease RseP (regulator of RpoE activity)
VEVESSRYAALLPDGSELASVDGAVVRSSSDLNSALAAAAPACASCASRSLSVEFKNASSDVTEKVFVPPTALVVRDLQPDSPSAGVLRAGDVVYSIDGASVSDIAGLKAVLSARAPGDEILVESSYAPEGKKMVLGSAPGDAGKAFVGAVFAQEQSFAGRDVPIAGSEALFSLVSLLFVVLYYAFALNFILAAVNLLPLFITDGQRVLYEELRAALGKKTAARASIALGLIGLALLVINALPWVL